MFHVLVCAGSDPLLLAAEGVRGAGPRCRSSSASDSTANISNIEALTKQRSAVATPYRLRQLEAVHLELRSGLLQLFKPLRNRVGRASGVGPQSILVVTELGVHRPWRTHRGPARQGPEFSDRFGELVQLGHPCPNPGHCVGVPSLKQHVVLAQAVLRAVESVELRCKLNPRISGWGQLSRSFRQGNRKGGACCHVGRTCRPRGLRRHSNRSTAADGRPSPRSLPGWFGSTPKKKQQQKDRRLSPCGNVYEPATAT